MHLPSARVRRLLVTALCTTTTLVADEDDKITLEKIEVNSLRTTDALRNVSTRAAWVDIAPKGGAPLTSKACSHANPPGFQKGPLYALTAGQTYEVRFTKVPTADLDVLLQPFAP